jgi:hypothetical protein
MRSPKTAAFEASWAATDQAAQLIVRPDFPVGMLVNYRGTEATVQRDDGTFVRIEFHDTHDVSSRRTWSGAGRPAGPVGVPDRGQYRQAARAARWGSPWLNVGNASDAQTRLDLGTAGLEVWRGQFTSRAPP